MAVAVVVLAFVWWLMPGGNGSTPAAASPGKGRATTGSHQAPTTIGHPTPPASTGGSAHHRGGKTPSHVSLPPSHSTGRSARTRPTGPCDAAKVKLAVAVKSAHEGAGTKVRLAMSTTDGSTCSLGITPKVLETPDHVRAGHHLAEHQLPRRARRQERRRATDSGERVLVPVGRTGESRCLQRGRARGPARWLLG